MTDTKNKMMEALNHSEKLLLEKGMMLFEFEALDLENQPYYVFILMGKKGKAQMEKDRKSQSTIRFSDYGIIAHQGEGRITSEIREYAQDQALEIIKSQIN